MKQLFNTENSSNKLIPVKDGSSSRIDEDTLLFEVGILCASVTAVDVVSIARRKRWAVLLSTTFDVIEAVGKEPFTGVDGAKELEYGRA